jgi:Cdc6-like AAA superfamily ATPase
MLTLIIGRPCWTFTPRLGQHILQCRASKNCKTRKRNVRLSQSLAIFHRHHLKSSTVGQLAHDVVQWLCAPDTSVDYADALQRRVNNTGSWLICGNEYGQWKCNSDSLLWIYGTAGSGKTILSSTVVEDLLRHCESGPGIAVAYFYFKLDDVSKKNNTGMLRSLVKQLFERGNGESQALTKLFGKGNQRPTSSQLLSTLHDMMLEFTDTYIVLDALDECEERDDLFKALEEMGSWKTANIRLLCTSRDEKDIKDSIELIPMAHHHIKLSAAVTKDDIRTYIRERLRTDRTLRRWRGHPKVQEEIEISLVEKSDGM